MAAVSGRDSNSALQPSARKLRSTDGIGVVVDEDDLVDTAAVGCSSASALL
jgi:hypothetical protein